MKQTLEKVILAELIRRVNAHPDVIAADKSREDEILFGTGAKPDPRFAPLEVPRSSVAYHAKRTD